MVLTFDREGLGAIVCESHEHLYGVIQRWMEKNSPYIEYISPIAKALIEDPIQAMFCGPIELMRQAAQRLAACDFAADFTVLRTQYDHRDLMHRRHPERRMLEGPRPGALGSPSRPGGV